MGPRLFSPPLQMIETISGFDESNVMCDQYCALPGVPAHTGFPGDLIPGWKVFHDVKISRCAFRLPALPLQLSGDHPRGWKTPPGWDAYWHLRRLPGLRTRIPL